MLLKKADAPETWQLEAVDFINKLIARRPDCRLGINGAAELKTHVWLKEFDFKKLLKNEYKPLFVPSRGENYDKSSFL
jgi:serum/glucocorticoid-regulated kinase 2